MWSPSRVAAALRLIPLPANALGEAVQVPGPLSPRATPGKAPASSWPPVLATVATSGLDWQMESLSPTPHFLIYVLFQISQSFENLYSHNGCALKGHPS